MTGEKIIERVYRRTMKETRLAPENEGLNTENDRRVTVHILESNFVETDWLEISTRINTTTEI